MRRSYDLRSSGPAFVVCPTSVAAPRRPATAPPQEPPCWSPPQRSSRSTPTSSSSWPTRRSSATRTSCASSTSGMPRWHRPSRPTARGRGRRRPRGRARARHRGRGVRRRGARARGSAWPRPRSTLRRLLVPRDPDDDRDVILEVKAGEGGEESALFAGDLLRMYLRYAERRGWRTEIIDATESDLGGYKDVRVAVKAKGTPGRARAPWARLKYEGGVHRVQRVPVTESQGRIHTSAAGVLVMPEAEEVEVDHRRQRPAGSTSTARPGPVASRSTRPTRRCASPTCPPVSWCPARTRRASSRTRSRRCACCGPGCTSSPRRRPTPRRAAARRSQIRTVDRSERIRTYNFPENRLSDHRTGFKSYNLDTVLDGELDAVVQSAVDADEAARWPPSPRRARVSRRATRPARPRSGRPPAARPRPACPRRTPTRSALAAHLRLPRGRAPAMVLGGRGPRGIRGLVDERAARVPLQHLTGGGFPPARASVGPGVFVPRPETEFVAGLAMPRLPLCRAGRRAPVVVDLCTGSGAIALCLRRGAGRDGRTPWSWSDLAHAWAGATSPTPGWTWSCSWATPPAPPASG